MAKKIGRDRRDVRSATRLIAGTASAPRPRVQATPAEIERAQKAEAAAQAQLKKAKAARDAAWQQLMLRDRELNEAIDQLAADLIAKGFPAKNPFAAFGIAAPAVLTQLPAAKKEQEVQRLVTALSQPKLPN